MVPKVFLSYASEDKERFVLSFAEKLRIRGVDAWLDIWEIYPGDSLIEKIFEEGLKYSQAIIIILSKNSVNKPWVKEELNASMVKKINEGSKLIPVIIDDCEVPQCLQSTSWQKIENLNDYDKEFDRIVISIFNHTSKPSLGPPPKYVNSIIDILPGLNKLDSLFMKIACEEAIKEDMIKPILNEIEKKLIELQFSKVDIYESMLILSRKGYLKIEQAKSGDIYFFSITPHGLEEYARVYIGEYDSIISSVIYSILNKNIKDNFKIAEDLKQPMVIINHILIVLESYGLVTLAKNYSGEFISVYNVSPELKRSFR